MHTNNKTARSEERSFFISTHGCQMNVHDTERMSCLLEMSGYCKAPSADEAQLIIINSCSIREKPVLKTKGEMGRYRKMKRQRPHLKLGVAGCVAQQERARLFDAIPGLDFVLGTDAIDTLPSLLAKLDAARQKRPKAVAAKLSPKAPYHIQTLIKNPKVTAFVNISKGCDNFCSFCVVPFTRGREVSRPLEHILKDTHSLYERGVREVTLLGQNVNSYRSPCGADFARLLASLADSSKIQRIRFTTPHPKDFNEGLVDVMQARRDKIMSFIHLPAQSGNTEVLRRMGRGYSRSQYVEKARMIQDRMPGAALSTDMIVGFPGETEEAFQDTLSLLDEIPFENMFSFKYSPRPYTKARLFKDQVDEGEKGRRLSLLQKKHRGIAFSLAKRYKGRVLKVLAEEKDPKTGLVMGRSPENKKVYFKGSREDIGQIAPVRIDIARGVTCYGEKV